jgi:hypothetical protein
MAFKFHKGNEVIGDLIAADDPQKDTKIDFSNDKIDFVVSGTVVASITPNQFSASVYVGNGSSLTGVSGGGGGGGTTLTVSGTSADGIPYNSTVSKITFDNNTGFQVSQSAPNQVFLSIGSHYKNIFVQGQPTLIATGSDSLEIKGTGGVTITTTTIDSNADGVNKELTISTSALSSSFSSSISTLNAKQFTASPNSLPFYNSSSIPSTLIPPSENRQNYVLGWVNNQLAWVVMSTGVSFLTANFNEVVVEGYGQTSTEQTIEISQGTIV